MVAAMPTEIINTARKACPHWRDLHSMPVVAHVQKAWECHLCCFPNTYCIMKPTEKPINLRLESFEMNGARKLRPQLEEFVRRARSRSKDEQVYLDAEIRLLSSPEGLRHAITSGWNRIGYTEHKRDAKGKLISCRAYVLL